jgi:hypothetical protein
MPCSRSQLLRASSLAILCALLLAACGGKDKNQDAKSEDRAATTEQSGRDERPERTSKPESGGEGSGSLPSGPGGQVPSLPGLSPDLQKCVSFAAAFTSLVILPAGIAGGVSQDELEKARASLEQVAGEVPKEIEKEASIVVPAFEEFFAAVKDKGFGSPELDKIADRTVNSPEVQQALDTIRQWIDAHCEGMGVGSQE